MASIEKRGNSYRIKVSCGYKADGTQVFQRMTWTPDPKMTAKQIEKHDLCTATTAHQASL